jgi:DNA-binding transcriptional LysR family regulator
MELNFATLDLNLLRVFVALLEERSVTRAGARLHLTPSAISHALNRLRQMVRDDLFVRGPDGMRPTPRATEIGPRLRQALEGLEAAFAPVDFEPLTSERQFTIGGTDYFSSLLLPEILARTRAEAPRVELRLRPLDDIDVVGELDAGRLDLVVSSFRRVPERFASEPLWNDDFVVVLRRDHPAAAKRLTLATFAALPHLVIMLSSRASEAVDGVVAQHGLELHRLAQDSAVLDAELAKSGLRRRIYATVPHFLPAARILTDTDMVALMPRRLALRFQRVYPLIVKPQPHECSPFQVSAVWHARLGASAPLDWLRGVIRAAAASLTRLEPLPRAAPPRPKKTAARRP